MFDFDAFTLIYRLLFNMVLKWPMAGEPGSTTKRKMKRQNWIENGKRFKTLFRNERDPPPQKIPLSHLSRCLGIKNHTCPHISAAVSLLSLYNNFLNMMCMYICIISC